MFKPRHPGTAALLALTLVGIQTANALAAPADALDAGSFPAVTPITIDASSFTQTAGKAPRTWLSLSFRNTGRTAADEVLFVVHYQGAENVIVDKGLFAPGTAIRHEFIAGVGSRGRRDASDVGVRYVHFTDGTHWGDSPRDLRRQQRA